MQAMNMDAHPDISQECIKKAFIIVFQVLRREKSPSQNLMCTDNNWGSQYCGFLRSWSAFLTFSQEMLMILVLRTPFAQPSPNHLLHFECLIFVFIVCSSLVCLVPYLGPQFSSLDLCDQQLILNNNLWLYNGTEVLNIVLLFELSIWESLYIC